MTARRRPSSATEEKSVGQRRLELLQDDDNAFVNLSSTLALGPQAAGREGGSKWKERKEQMRKKRARDRVKDDGSEGGSESSTDGEGSLNADRIFLGSGEFSAKAPARLNLTSVFVAEEQRADRQSRKPGHLSAQTEPSLERVDNHLRTFSYFGAPRRNIFREHSRQDQSDYARQRKDNDQSQIPTASEGGRKSLLLLCSVCLDPAKYRCPKCTIRKSSNATQLLSNPQSYFCSLSCLEIHQDVRCNKFVV